MRPQPRLSQEDLIEIDRRVRYILDGYTSVPPGQPGLRRVGNGPQDAASGAGNGTSNALAADAYIQHHARTTRPDDANDVLTQRGFDPRSVATPARADDAPTVLAARAVQPPPPPPTRADDASLILHQAAFGI